MTTEQEYVVTYRPDSAVVERFVARDLAELRPEVVHADAEQVIVTTRGFGLLHEYSTSKPTGVADGKVWKSLTTDAGWVLREYVDDGHPDGLLTVTRRLEVLDMTPQAAPPVQTFAVPADPSGHTTVDHGLGTRGVVVQVALEDGSLDLDVGVSALTADRVFVAHSRAARRIVVVAA